MQKRERTLARRLAARPPVMFEHLDDLIPDRAMRGERGHRVLEDKADLRTANPIERAFVERKEILAGQLCDAAHLRFRCSEAKRREQQLALARP